MTAAVSKLSGSLTNTELKRNTCRLYIDEHFRKRNICSSHVCILKKAFYGAKAKQANARCGMHSKQLRLLFAPFARHWAEFNPYAARQVIAKCVTSCKQYLDHLAHMFDKHHKCDLFSALLFILMLFGELV